MTPTDLQAVTEALRTRDRFLLVTHENPDGDALGSILATKLALDQLGKDAVMYVHGDAPLPAHRQVRRQRAIGPGRGEAQHLALLLVAEPSLVALVQEEDAGHDAVPV